MSIITDDMVQDALEFLAQDPHPIAAAKAELTRSENGRRAVRSKMFLVSSAKTIAEREAMAESSPDYLGAIEREAQASEAYEGARAKMTWASTVIDIWRSENANARVSDRVR